MSKKQPAEQTDNGRRKFIKTLGAAGGAAAVIAASGEVAADVDMPEKAEAEVTKGYRETEHVREYYKSARI